MDPATGFAAILFALGLLSLAVPTETNPQSTRNEARRSAQTQRAEASSERKRRGRRDTDEDESADGSQQ